MGRHTVIMAKVDTRWFAKGKTTKDYARLTPSRIQKDGKQVIQIYMYRTTARYNYHLNMEFSPEDANALGEQLIALAAKSKGKSQAAD